MQSPGEPPRFSKTLAAAFAVMAANGLETGQPRPAAVPSSAYLSASSSVASLHTAPSSQEPVVLSLTLQDGRTLAYALMGAPIEGAAAVCIYHHGVPASLVEAEPLAAAAAPLGIAVVAFDRPGERMWSAVAFAVEF